MLTPITWLAGLVAKSMGRVSPSLKNAEEASQRNAQRNCLYEVEWAIGDPTDIPQQYERAPCEITINSSAEVRTTAAALSAVQLSASQSHSIRVTEDSSAVSGLLRCAARELPTLRASLNSINPNALSGKRGSIRLQLAESQVPSVSDVYGSRDREGAVWRPQLVQSSAPAVQGAPPH